MSQKSISDMEVLEFYVSLTEEQSMEIITLGEIIKKQQVEIEHLRNIIRCD